MTPANFLEQLSGNYTSDITNARGIMQDTISILLADDESTFRESTADLLRIDGYHCETARDAQSALTIIGEGEYDVLVSDIKMPGNDQLELIQKVQEIAPGIRTILVTGYPSAETAIKSIKLPVTEYLAKPFEYEDLQAAIKSAASTSKSYKVLKNSKQRLDDWKKELGQIEETMLRDTSALSIDTFFSLTLAHIIGSLEDLRNLSNSFAAKDAAEQACHMFDCPRVETLVGTLTQSIDVLEKTRTSFKSKELYQLRKKIENVVTSVSSRRPQQ